MVHRAHRYGSSLILLSALLLAGGREGFAQASEEAAAPMEAASLLPEDLDTTPLEGPHAFTGGVVYLGKENRKISKAIKEGDATYELHGRREGKKYQSFQYSRGREWFFRIEDKKGNKIHEQKLESNLNPILIEEADMFAVPIKIGVRESEMDPIVGGLRFYDLKGKLLGEIDPSATGKIRILKVNKNGIALVNTPKGESLAAYDHKGRKLWEVAPLPEQLRFSPDGQYFYTHGHYTKGGQVYYRGFLYDMKGHALHQFDDTREVGPDYVAISEDSKFVGYREYVPEAQRSDLYVIDIATKETAYVLPGAGSFHVAISRDAAYVAYVWPSGTNTSEGQLVDYRFKVLDSRGTFLGDYDLGSRIGWTNRWPRFLEKSLVVVEGEDDRNHYFRIAGGHGR